MLSLLAFMPWQWRAAELKSNGNGTTNKLKLFIGTTNTQKMYIDGLVFTAVCVCFFLFGRSIAKGFRHAYDFLLYPTSTLHESELARVCFKI